MLFIVIIAILAAILFPVFARAQENGRKAACLSNLKQLGEAHMMYVQDYDDTYPLSVQGPDRRGKVYWAPTNLVASQNSPEYQAWYGTQGANAVRPYTKNDQIWACPSSTPADLPFTGLSSYPAFTPGVNPIEISHMYNGPLGACTLSEVYFPGNVPLLWEGGFRSSLDDITIWLCHPRSRIIASCTTSGRSPLRGADPGAGQRAPGCGAS